MADPFSKKPEIPDSILREFLKPPTPDASGELMRALAAQPPTVQSAQPPEKSPALKLLDCLASGKKLLENPKTTQDSIVQWTRRVRFALFSIFGKDAVIVKDADALIKQAQTKGLSREDFAQKLADVESLVSYVNRVAENLLACSVSQTSRVPSTKDVFIIHGHDELNTRRLHQLLQGHFGLNPIAMLARPGMSRPLTQKFEDEAQTCSFAFALFTPDDEVTKSGQPYNQARPNVIYEVGWFIGRLGRERVSLILKSGTRIHSDLDGVSQIRFTENIEEKFLEIQNELKAAKLIA